MAKYKDDGEAYLAMYLHIAKRWINECIICHMQGYKPTLPEKVVDGSDQMIMRDNLMKYFRPLFVDDLGMCAQCAQNFDE